MQYSIEFRPVVLKTLKRFPKQDLIRIKKKIDGLGSKLPNPNITATGRSDISSRFTHNKV